MYNYNFVSSRESKEVKKLWIELMHDVQDLVRDKFTLRFDFIGSSIRNMITCDYSQNIGYDHDVNITVNDPNESFSPQEIKTILIDAFKKRVSYFEFDSVENSTRVITVKKIDSFQSRIIHSCDFAIVHHDQYIRYNKTQNTYTWEFQPKSYLQLKEKEVFCKQKKVWNEVREHYLHKKNTNSDIYKKSRSIYVETINEIAQKYGFFQREGIK